MQYRPFGMTGIQVSELCLGAMMLGSFGNADHDDSIRVIHSALDRGVNFIDTADVYSDGESEEIVGKAVKGQRDDVVIATKCHLPQGGLNRRGSSRRWIMQAVEESLRRLQTDHIDLYQIHRLDSTADHDETLGALTDLVHQGKVLYLGSSTYPASEVVEAQWVADRRQRQRFVCEQPPYSMLTRAIEAELLPVCQRYAIAVIPWAPLCGGWLSGRWRKGAETIENTRAKVVPDRYDLTKEANQLKLGIVEELAVLAEEIGLSLIHLALAFVLEHPAITSVIIGPRTTDHLDSQIGATGVSLDVEVLERIDAIVPPGTNVVAADAGYVPNAISDPSLRRRPK